MPPELVVVLPLEGRVRLFVLALSFEDEATLRAELSRRDIGAEIEHALDDLLASPWWRGEDAA